MFCLHFPLPQSVFMVGWKACRQPVLGWLCSVGLRGAIVHIWTSLANLQCLVPSAGSCGIPLPAILYVHFLVGWQKTQLGCCPWKHGRYGQERSCYSACSLQSPSTFCTIRVQQSSVTLPLGERPCVTCLMVEMRTRKFTPFPPITESSHHSLHEFNTLP